MAKQTISPALTAFREQLTELTESWYDGSPQKAFRHAAFQQVAPDPNLTDPQIIEMTAIDKSDDLEIDGWFEDETSEEFLLFQSEGGKNPVSGWEKPR